MLNMSPCFSVKNVTNAPLGYVVFFGQCHLSKSTARIFPPDLNHFIIGKLCGWVALPNNSKHAISTSSGRGLSSFQDHVRSVFFWGSNKQMEWVNTWRIITVMTDLFSGWYRAVNKLVRNSVSRCSAIVDFEPSVTTTRNSAVPVPAAFNMANGHSAPKQWLKRDALFFVLIHQMLVRFLHSFLNCHWHVFRIANTVISGQLIK